MDGMPSKQGEIDYVKSFESAFWTVSAWSQKADDLKRRINFMWYFLKKLPQSHRYGNHGQESFKKGKWQIFLGRGYNSVTGVGRAKSACPTS